MSMHDNGYGRKAGLNPASQTDFASSESVDPAPSMQTWGNTALKAEKSEVILMAQGAGRPGQPVIGQRSIFGGGSPVFAQMPTYTPVTRGLDQRQPAPEPPQPAYNLYTPPSPAQPSYSSPQPQAPLSYQNSHPAAAPSYQSPHPTAAPSYQNSHPAAPSYPSLQPAATPSYQAADLQTQAYRGANQQVRPSSYPSAEHAGAQTYPASSYNGAQGFPSQPYRDQSFADASFQDPNAGDASFPETSFADASFQDPNAGDASFPETSFADQNYADPNLPNQSFANQSLADASFPEQGFDASFSDASFPSTSSFTHQEQPSFDGNGYAQAQAPADQGFDTFTEEAAQDYVMASQSGQVPQSDPRRQLQAFDALYDQPPQIPLGSTDQSRPAPQDFYEGERVDADFLDEGQVLPTPGARSKMAMTIRGRSAFMVGSALLGAIALGGALAFAYKQSGGGMSSEHPPLVQADNRPVKEVPDQPGGKDFPPKNKLIYDRLQNGDEAEGEHLVPRQENVAVPALPSSTETAGMPAPVATTDLATTQAVDQAGGAPIAVASVDDAADGGPRRVKTMVVRPDGSVQAPPESAAAPAEAPSDMQLAAAGPPPAQAAAVPPAAVEAAPPAPVVRPAPPQQVAALQPAPVKPKPVKPAVQTAAATPQAATAAAPTKYVVQVGSKKNQTEALASFADMQQKYPALLANYRPMVQKADLGAKGTWYRLRIGPISDKTAAAKLCTQLKSQGMADCLVTSQ
jgi:SPOR domain